MSKLRFSIEDIESLDPSVAIALEMQIHKMERKGYTEFVDIIWKALNFSINDMSTNKNIIAGMDEDQLTHLLISPLKTMAFDASHSKNINGNCDIIVNGHSSFLWLGEAKIFTSYTKLLGGYRQLAARYATGMENQDHGSLLIYMQKHGKAKVRMDEWRDYLLDVEDEITAWDGRNPLEFNSRQVHQGTGLPLFVVHRAIVLFHQPTDTQKAPPRVRRKKGSVCNSGE